ncbi:MAG: hypothetical protein CVT73_11985 [Alphaproteobacteria bacterium HGW-Alphaproteobacteria-12]|nr:MAG: hypothetical protein CVT73_11985 [Alphaproteobacteria bacterium HGW-Alphaproteobacteria-12]
MNRNMQMLLVGNGALVFLAGMLAGFPYASVLVASVDPGAATMWPGDLRAWKMAHLEGALNGMLMIAVGAAMAQAAMTARVQSIIVWGLIVTGWGNIIASFVSAMTGGRGLGFTGADWNTVTFTLFMVAILGVVAAMIAVAWAAFTSRR